MGMLSQRKSLPLLLLLLLMSLSVHAFIDGDVRLMDGNSTTDGRVEIFFDESWGTICDDNWDNDDATVVCRQLGIGSAGVAHLSGRFGAGTGPILLDDVQCSGSENNLLLCNSNGLGTHNCAHSEDAGVTCENSVRLVGDSITRGGMVEIFHNGVWGTICDDNWDDRDAAVICRQLGFGNSGKAIGLATFGEGSGNIWLDDVECDGSEEYVYQCGYSDWGSHNCGHSEDAGVVCEDAVRLVGGTEISEGRVEIFHNDEWGTVCDDQWDNGDATVVCRQLNLGGSGTATHSAEFGEGSETIWLDDVRCVGTESDIQQCSKNDWGSNNCQHSEDAGVKCSKVRLAGGNSLSEGRVEVFYNGNWGTVCDDIWDNDDATVVCRQLGFSDSAGAALSSAAFGRGIGSIWLDNVQCDGSEKHLFNCSSNGLGSHNCGHAEDASVICDNTVRLSGGSEMTEGRVEVFHNGVWGTVCDDNWDQNDVAVVCTQLGYGTSGEVVISSEFGEGTGIIWLDEVQCIGTEKRIEQCIKREWGSNDCGHNEDAAVRCTTTEDIGECGGDLTESSGTIESLRFPIGYANNLQCIWLIRALPDMVIELTIQSFQLENSLICALVDYLTVFDGSSTSGEVLIPPSCGTAIKWPPIPTVVVSTENSMLVKFRSDATVSDLGFHGTYQQVPPREEFFLIADATNGYIYKQNKLGSNHDRITATGLSIPTALDYDPVEHNIYFTDVGEHIIGRINIDGTGQVVIASSNVEVPDGIAVDHVSRVLYWTDAGTNTITTSSLDGTERSILIDTDLDQPRDIVVFNEQGLIYWSDWGSSPKIEHCQQDGSERVVIISSELGWPNGLALDKYESKLYWVDAQLNRVERCSYDGSSRELVKQFTADIHPFGLIVLEQAVFWTDWATGGITYADKYFLQEPRTLQVAGSSTRLHGIAYYSSVDSGVGCPDGWLPYINKYYCVFRNQMTWNEASRTCADLDGHLVWIQSQGENEFVDVLITSTDYVWIGHSDQEIEGIWNIGVGVSPSTYTNWETGQPNNEHNEDCAVMYGTLGEESNLHGYWNDVPCCLELEFICERN